MAAQPNATGPASGSAATAPAASSAGSASSAAAARGPSIAAATAYQPGIRGRDPHLEIGALCVDELRRKCPDEEARFGYFYLGTWLAQWSQVLYPAHFSPAEFGQSVAQMRKLDKEAQASADERDAARRLPSLPEKKTKDAIRRMVGELLGAPPANPGALLRFLERTTYVWGWFVFCIGREERDALVAQLEGLDDESAEEALARMTDTTLDVTKRTVELTAIVNSDPRGAHADLLKIIESRESGRTLGDGELTHAEIGAAVESLSEVLDDEKLDALLARYARGAEAASRASVDGAGARAVADAAMADAAGDINVDDIVKLSQEAYDKATAASAELRQRYDNLNRVQRFFVNKAMRAVVPEPVRQAAASAQAGQAGPSTANLDPQAAQARAESAAAASQAEVTRFLDTAKGMLDDPQIKARLLATLAAQRTRLIALVRGYERPFLPLDAREYKRIFEARFHQYFPHEQCDRSPMNVATASAVANEGDGAPRKLYAYLDDYIEYAAEMLTRIERDWAIPARLSSVDPATGAEVSAESAPAEAGASASAAAPASSPSAAAKGKQPADAESDGASASVAAEPPPVSKEDQDKNDLLTSFGHVTYTLSSFFLRSNFVEQAWLATREGAPNVIQREFTWWSADRNGTFRHMLYGSLSEISRQRVDQRLQTESPPRSKTFDKDGKPIPPAAPAAEREKLVVSGYFDPIDARITLISLYGNVFQLFYMPSNVRYAGLQMLDERVGSKKFLFVKVGKRAVGAADKKAWELELKLRREQIAYLERSGAAITQDVLAAFKTAYDMDTEFGTSYPDSRGILGILYWMNRNGQAYATETFDNAAQTRYLDRLGSGSLLGKFTPMHEPGCREAALLAARLATYVAYVMAKMAEEKTLLNVSRQTRDSANDNSTDRWTRIDWLELLRYFCGHPAQAPRVPELAAGPAAQANGPWWQQVLRSDKGPDVEYAGDESDLASGAAAPWSAAHGHQVKFIDDATYAQRAECAKRTQLEQQFADAAAGPA